MLELELHFYFAHPWQSNSMRNASIVLFIALVFIGCKSTKVRDDAVMRAIPPRTSGIVRVSNERNPDDVESGSADEIRQLGNEQRIDSVDIAFTADGRIDADTQVVATVNNVPIFASEILGRYRQQLVKAREQISPEQYNELRNSLIKRDLQPRIERKLLVQNLHRTLKDEQIKAIEGQLTGMFAGEIQKLKKEFKVHSNLELEQELQKQGTSLSSLKDEFANQRMAMEYLGAKANVKRDFSRQDLLQFYQDHAQDYQTPKQVQWQQIQISFDKHDGRSGAFEPINTIVLELKNGADFAELARKYSDGPTAKEGGQWGWTQSGSLSDSKIEQVLFEIPVGKISQIEQDQSFQLIRVTQRQNAGIVPFEKIQDEIRKTLEQQSQKQAVQKVLDDLFATAVIEYHIPE